MESNLLYLKQVSHQMVLCPKKELLSLLKKDTTCTIKEFREDILKLEPNLTLDTLIELEKINEENRLKEELLRAEIAMQQERARAEIEAKVNIAKMRAQKEIEDRIKNLEK